MTRVVSLSARRSRCEAAKTERKRSIPEPVFAEIPIIGVMSAASDEFSRTFDLISLFSSEETIKLMVLELFAISQMSVLLSKKTSF